MSSERDRGLLRRAMKEWPRRFKGLDEEAKQEFVAGLRLALKDADDIEEPKDRGHLRESCARTAVMMERLHQADDHKAAELDLRSAELELRRERGNEIPVEPANVTNIQVNMPNDHEAVMEFARLMAERCAGPGNNRP